MTAQEQYNKNFKAVIFKINKLRELLATHKKVANSYPDDWAFVEDLDHVKELLVEVCEFLQKELTVRR